MSLVGSRLRLVTTTRFMTNNKPNSSPGGGSGARLGGLRYFRDSVPTSSSALLPSSVRSMALRAVMDADDYRNVADQNSSAIPIKKQELYKAVLLAKHHRLRLDREFEIDREKFRSATKKFPFNINMPMNMQKTEADDEREVENHNLDDDEPEIDEKEDAVELYEKAKFELKAMGLDDSRSTKAIDLCRELHCLLDSQIEELFERFSLADDILRIPVDEIETVDLEQFECKDILLDEIVGTEAIIKDTPKENTQSLAFLERKKAAIETLLRYHGWQDENEEYTKLLTTGPEEAVDPFGINLADKAMSERQLLLLRKHQTINLCRSALIRLDTPYSVITLQSFANPGQRGLFLDGKTKAGSLVAFFPGEIFLKDDILNSEDKKLEEAPGLIQDTVAHSFYELLDDGSLDGTQSPVTALLRQDNRNPWAIGHVARSSAPTSAFNSQVVPVNFWRGLGKYQIHHEQTPFSKYIPNWYAGKLSLRRRLQNYLESISMHGLGLILLKDIENNEVILK